MGEAAHCLGERLPPGAETYDRNPELGIIQDSRPAEGPAGSESRLQPAGRTPSSPSRFVAAPIPCIGPAPTLNCPWSQNGMSAGFQPAWDVRTASLSRQARDEKLSGAVQIVVQILGFAGQR
jgi:hypothetical protein